MYWRDKLILGLARGGGAAGRAAIYGFGGRFFSRSLYREQGRALLSGGSFPGPAMSLSFDVDYPEDALALPELLGLLAKYELKASFAVIGRLVEEYAAEHRLLTEQGREIVNHTWSHPDHETYHPGESFDSLSAEEQREQIVRCHETCERLLGAVPRGFRAPHFGNVKGRGFYSLLREAGYRYSSSVIAATAPGGGAPYDAAEGIVEIPVSCCPAHPFAVLDTWHCLPRGRGRHRANGEFAALVEETLALAAKEGAYVNLYLDPRDVADHYDARLVLETLARWKDRLRLLDYGELVDMLPGSVSPSSF